MKKKLFLLLCALLTMIGVQAQTDVTSMYLTNPSFETDAYTGTNASPTGWTTSGTPNQYLVVITSHTMGDGYGDVTSLTDGEKGYGIRSGWNQNNNPFSLYQSVTLPAGYYRLSVDEKSVYATEPGSSGTASIELYAGDQKSVYNYTANLPATTSFFPDENYKYATKTIEFYSDGEARNIGVKVNFTSKRQDLVFDNFKLYQINADAADYAALNDAIAAAEAYTPGFETGEYAPYTNKDAFVSLAVAKAIDPSVPNKQSTVQEATAALTSAEWTANATEVNAIRWNIADYPDTGAETKVPTGGFVGSDSGSRISHKSADGGNVGLRGLDQYMALMVIANTNATYGETEGYTLPLKASTVYEFKFKYAGWGECGTPTITILKGSDKIEEVELTTPAKTGNDNEDAWEPASVVFQTNAAGDYKVKFSTSSGRDAFGDLELKKAPASVSKTISAAGWATFCSPYALDLEHATDLTDAYIVTGGNAGVLTKTSVKGGTVPANTGLLLKGAAGTATIPVVASSSTNVEANKLVGVNAATEIAANAGYVLMGSPSLGFYQNSVAFTVGANTAYLPSNFDVSGARDFFRLEDDFTGINAIEAAEAKAEGLKDGKFLIGNKVVLVKNGVKYSANGQILK